MDQQGQPWGPAEDCKRNHSEKCTGKCKRNHSENESGNCTGNCNGNHSEKCTGSCKVNCNHSGNRTGKCSGNCIGNHTENCKGNCSGNSSESCPPAAGEPIKSLVVALSLSLLSEGGSIWITAAPLAPRWWNWRAAGTTTSPHCCQGWQGRGVALASTREALWIETCRCWRAALWPSHPGEVGTPLHGGWQLFSEPCSWPALHAWPHSSYCLIICINNQKII